MEWDCSNCTGSHVEGRQAHKPREVSQNEDSRTKWGVRNDTVNEDQRL